MGITTNLSGFATTPTSRPRSPTSWLPPPGSSYHTGDIPLGIPTCSARSRQGRWALYPNDDEVAGRVARRCLVGPAVEVAQTLDRLGDGQDDLDRAAVRAVGRF